MTWPAKRIQRSALWKATETDDTPDYRRKTARRRETRRMVRGSNGRRASAANKGR